MNLNSLLKEIKQSKYQIYLDMDEVICDFDGRYEHFTGKSPMEMDKELTQKYGKKKSQEIFWTKVDPVGPKFWSEMDKTSDADKLIDFLKPFGFKLLSSPSRSTTSREGKKEWVDKNLSGVELILRIASEKQEFANPNSILIDDMPKNIDRWKAKGGIGILHKNANDTIKQLEELGYKKEDNLNEIQIDLGRDENYKDWLKFYKENKDKIEYLGFSSLDDIENTYNEIREKILNTVKHKFVNHLRKKEYDWNIEDKILVRTDERFEFKYGFDFQELKWFFEGLRKYRKRTSLNEITIDTNFIPKIGEEYWFDNNGWLKYEGKEMGRVGELYVFSGKRYPVGFTIGELQKMYKNKEILRASSFKDLSEIKILPFKYDDLNYYEGIYMGGSEKIDEYLRVDQIGYFMFLGNKNICLLPGGDSKVFIMDKKFFELKKIDRNMIWGKIDPKEYMDYIKSKIEEGEYVKL